MVHRGWLPRLINPLSSRHWRDDLHGGVAAAAVALPLALAFGVVSGAGSVAGLYGAICCGLFATLRLGRYIGLLPYSVSSGFANGVGCIIHTHLRNAHALRSQ